MNAPVTVEFTGARSGQGPLTWGQRAIWRLTEWLPPGYPCFNPFGERARGGGPSVETAEGRGDRPETKRQVRKTGDMVQRAAGHGWLTVELVDAAGAAPPGTPEEPSFVKLGMESAALGGAVTRLAARVQDGIFVVDVARGAPLAGPATHTCWLDLLADTALLPREAIEATLREVETLLVSEENT